MLLASRFSGQELVLKWDLIQKIQPTREPVTNLSGGSFYLVREAVQEVAERMIAFRCSVIRAASFPEAGEQSPMVRVVKAILVVED